MGGTKIIIKVMDGPSTNLPSGSVPVPTKTEHNPAIEHANEYLGSPLARTSLDDTSDEDSVPLQRSMLSEDAYTGKPSSSSDPHTAPPLSPKQLSSRMSALHLPTSPSSLSGRSASRSREGYGFRPTSGPSTPLGIEGIHVQPGTAGVVDKNGLGWPGMSILVLPLKAHFDLLTIEQATF